MSTENEFDFAIMDRSDQWLADHGQPTNTDLRRQMSMVNIDSANGSRDALDYLIEMRRARTTWTGVLENGLRWDVDRLIEIKTVALRDLLGGGA
ncbi:hypothetical protein [Azotobacter salinestris]|uniref:hypothetical protein n=1 Tax=Azotobacter salinestris TaxID=69964 RepID=UPI00126698C1|nr:hypothetical protein [Azotobacter salinestris]